jgi:hypothetical protein
MCLHVLLVTALTCVCLPQTGVAYRPHGEGVKQAEPVDLISILSATTSALPTGDLGLTQQVQQLLGLPQLAMSDPASLLTTQKFPNHHVITGSVASSFSSLLSSQRLILARVQPAEPSHNPGTVDLNFLRQSSADLSAAKMPSQLPSLNWALFAPAPFEDPNVYVIRSALSTGRFRRV